MVKNNSYKKKKKKKKIVERKMNASKFHIFNVLKWYSNAISLLHFETKVSLRPRGKLVSGYNRHSTTTIPDYLRLSLERSRRNASNLILIEQFFRLPKRWTKNFGLESIKERRVMATASKKSVLIFFTLTSDTAVRQRSVALKFIRLQDPPCPTGRPLPPDHSPGNPRYFLYAGTCKSYRICKAKSASNKAL